VKIIGRILIILAAALVVVGAVYGITQLLPGDQLVGGRGERGAEFDGNRPANFAGPDGDFEGLGARPEGGEGHGERASWSFRETLRNLVVVGVVTLIVGFVNAGWNRLRRWRRRAASAA
jgi:hypothetical protein